MGLRSMHEQSKQESSLQLGLIEQQSQRIAELESRISELSSTNSTLMSELQKKSETIKSLNDKIGKLAESDNVLKLNAELKQHNEQLQKEKQAAIAKAETEVSSVKREYAQKAALLERQRSEAALLQKQLQEQKANSQKHIREQAESMSKSEMLLYKGFLLGCLLYGVLCTVLTAARSEAFVSDFKAFFVAIWGFIRVAAEKLLELSKWASQLGDMIPQDVVAVIAHWLILVAVTVLLGGGVAVLLIIGISKAYGFYKEGYADQTSLAVALVSLAVAVFFAEPIRQLVPVNLILLLIITHVLYVGVRWYIKGYRSSRGY